MKTKILVGTASVVFLAIALSVNASHKAVLEQLQKEIASLQRERDALAAENQRGVLELENSKRAIAQPQKAAADSKETQADAESQEASNDFCKNMEALAQKASLIYGYLQKTPGAFIPELRLLAESEWIGLAEFKDLSTPDSVQRAMSWARILGKQHFLREYESAVSAYKKNHARQMPTELSQLKPYFKDPSVAEMLNRYQLVDPSGWELGSGQGLKPRGSTKDAKNVLLLLQEKASPIGGLEKPAQMAYSERNTWISLGVEGWMMGDAN